MRTLDRFSVPKRPKQSKAIRSASGQWEKKKKNQPMRFEHLYHLLIFNL